MESAGDECRICCLEGQYNIFNDELCFDPKNDNKTKTKIYIILNNFLYEKLYSQDEYSSVICAACCNNLCDSYTFMKRVRKAEQHLRLGTLRESLGASETKQTSPVKDFPIKPKQSESIASKDEDIVTEDENDEEALEELYEKEDSEEVEPKFEEIEDTVEEEAVVYDYVELVPGPVNKKQKRNPTPKVQTPASITYTHYELVAYKEHDQNVIVINTYPTLMHLPKTGTYEFDTSWINHKPDEPTIFKCKLCVKAFSTVDFLLKHNLSCHHCLTCLQMFEGYKELTQHSREHSSVVCHFCGKNCGSSSNFRQHLKKQHLLKFPSWIGILGE